MENALAQLCEDLARSEAEIAAGLTIPASVIIAGLHRAADELEAKPLNVISAACKISIPA